MADSFLIYLECSRCGARHEADRVQNLCGCGAPLLARYDLARLATSVSREELQGRERSLWRYRELLPIRDWRYRVALGEGWTPLLQADRLGPLLGLGRLLIKDEGLLPTGTFKARGAAVGVSRALELGVRSVAMPTAGNAGGAWAAYCARAGIPLTVVMPADAPAVNVQECVAFGARTFLVNGFISDAGRVVARAIARHGWFDASTLKEPYRIEGKKTMGFELVEQLGWRFPDVVLCPAGGGVGLIGMWKAFHELREVGWAMGDLPRLVAVQAEGCAPLVRAWEQGAEESELWENPHTIASGIRVPKALGDFLVLRALRETGGRAVSVTDAEILSAMGMTARAEGLLACPEGAATVAAAQKLARAGWLDPEQAVVLLNTGTGLKYADVLDVSAPIIGRDEDLPDSGEGE